jgi:hypothetical protein
VTASVLAPERAAISVAFGGLHALDGFLIAANAAAQYVLARRRAAQDAG